MGSDDEITAAMEEVSISQIVDELIDYYKEKKIINWEEIVALGLADEDLSKHNAEYNIGEWDSGNYDQPTDYATKILANLALGNDPASYNERDLIEGLTELQQENGSFGGGANNSVWSIIALDGALAAGCEVSYELEKAVAFLISQQTADGGYTLMGDTGDPDMTGDVLLALGRYKNVLEVSESIDRAVAFLKDIQLDTAGYASWGKYFPRV
jgi:squalene cyclase